MKKIKRLVVAMSFLFAFFAAGLAVKPATVKAAGQPTFVKSILLMVGDGKEGNMGWGVMNTVKSDKILKLKSSKPDVLSVKRSKFLDEYNIMVNAKKAGTSTISFEVKRKNGKVYRFKSKVKVYNYESPFSKCTFGKTDYKKLFAEKSQVAILSGTAKKGNINVGAKKGYRLTGLYYCEYGTGKEKKIKSGSKITLNSQHYLRVEYKNLKKNYSYHVYLWGA